MNETDAQDKHDIAALFTLDEYYAALLNCQSSALRCPGWKQVPARAEHGSLSRQFGMRQVVYLLAPTPHGASAAGRAGVAALAPELSGSVGDLLDKTPPRMFFRKPSLDALDRLVRGGVTRPLAPGSQPHLSVLYATRSHFQSYLGSWVEMIERLDEKAATDPLSLALLARHGGGVFAVRVGGATLAYIGLRASSPHVWELTEPRLTMHAPDWVVKRPDELFIALVARATRAALDEGRIPICMTGPRASKLRRSLAAAGYRRYARASVYAITTP